MKRNFSLSLTSKLIIFGILVQLFHPGYAFAGGTVTVCDEGNLRAALAGGGLVTMDCDGTIVLTNTLAITSATTIDGTGHAVTISGGNTTRVFTVTSPINFTLMNLRIANGLAAGTNGAPGVVGGTGSGGGIYASGATVSLSNCQFVANIARGGVGGPTIGFTPGYRGGNALGGAIDLVTGFLVASNCVFAGNNALGGKGGGPQGDGGDAFGGAIRSTTGVVVLVNCRFETNQVHGGIIGDFDASGFHMAGGAFGGAICLLGSSLTNENSEFIANTGSTPSGARFTIGGPGRGGAIYIDAGSSAVIGGTFTSNYVHGEDVSYHQSQSGPGQGGAVYNAGQLWLANSRFGFNTAVGGGGGNPGGNGEGGAIYNIGTSSLSESWFDHNNVQGGFGIIRLVTAYPDGIGRGGAIFSSNSISISASTFSDNQALGQRAPAAGTYSSVPSSGFGGAIYNQGSCLVTNSTLTRNLALGGNQFANNEDPNGAAAFGGAICNSGGVVISVNNTLALNDAKGGTGLTNGIGYGGGIFSTNSSVTLLNSLLAAGSFGSNFSGTLTDAGHNLSSDSSCSFSGPGSLNNTDPVLGPLGDYGGPTPTVPLLTGSPAIDGGDTALGPLTDQRGRTRPYGAASDIGAFESSAPFVIRGHVSGYTLAGEVEVVCESTNVTTVKGNYSLEGLAAGPYAVTPTDPDYLFYPANRLLTVGPDQLGADFKAYRWNALSRESYSNGTLRLMFAGTNGLTYRVLFSTNVTDWVCIATNTTGSSNLFEIVDSSVLTQPAGFYRVVQP